MNVLIVRSSEVEVPVMRDINREARLSARLRLIRFLKLDLKPHCLISVDSTQDYLSNLSEHSKEGWFVISEGQTKGRGRQGRKWISDRGGVYISIRLDPPARFANYITELCASSILRTLSEDYDLKDLKIKAPNDILCRKKKIGGVLVDAKIIGETAVALAGMGINLNNGSSWSDELCKIATSYKIETKKRIEIDSFLIKLLSRLDWAYSSLISNHSKAD
jgi:BirA family biotin operon repressor/biotin-[acetyl-CoA-carboxylase] ligase